MTIRLKYWLFKSLNFTFRLIIPAITAGIIFGVFDNTEQTISWFSRFEMGAFVILLLAFTELKDYIKQAFKQFGMNNQLAFMHNNGVAFIMVAVVLLLVKLYADKAIDFFFIAGFSKLIAYFFELQSSKYYRIMYPSKQDIANNKLDELLDGMEAEDIE